MANELQFYGLLSQTGLTVYAKVYSSTGLEVGSSISCSETGSSAIYLGNMPTISEGQYGIRFFNDADDSLLGQGVICWSGTSEIDLTDLLVINRGIKNASLRIPHTETL